MPLTFSLLREQAIDEVEQPVIVAVMRSGSEPHLTVQARLMRRCYVHHNSLLITVILVVVAAAAAVVIFTEIHGRPQAWPRGALVPPWKCCKVFYAAVVTVKRSVDQLFMHYFDN